MSFSPKQLGKTFTVPNQTASGALVLPSAIENYRALVLSQTTAALTFTLPIPTDPSIIFSLPVSCVGTTGFTLLGVGLGAGQGLIAVWTGAAWLASTGPAAASLPVVSGTAYMPNGTNAVIGLTPAAAGIAVLFTLPAAGTYLVNYGVQATASSSIAGTTAALFTSVVGAQGGQFGVAGATGTPVPNTEVVGIYANITTNYIQVSGSGSTVVTISGPTTMALGTYNPSGTTSGNIRSDSLGRTFVTWVQLSTPGVAVPSIAQTGTSYAPSGINAPTSSSAFATTFMSIALPSAGTFEITYSVRGNNTGTAAGGLVAALYTGANATFNGVTGGTVVPNSEIKCIYISTSTQVQATATGVMLVTVLGPTTYVVGIYGDGTTTATAQSDANGRSSMSYIQIAVPATSTMTGATTSLAGAAGYVPQPPAATQYSNLTGGGVFRPGGLGFINVFAYTANATIPVAFVDSGSYLHPQPSAANQQLTLPAPTDGTPSKIFIISTISAGFSVPVFFGGNQIALLPLNASTQFAWANGAWRVMNHPAVLIKAQLAARALASGAIVQLNQAVVPTLLYNDGFVITTEQVTAPVSGLYLITGQVYWPANATGTRVLYVYTNNVQATEAAASAGATGTTSSNLTVQLAVAGGQLIGLGASQSSGASLSMTTSVLSVQLLRAL